jgi:uncharacterized BrkB/YihY/UPF0761 family membrane protein
MKPKLSNKKLISNFINKNNKIIDTNHIDKNNIFFNFIIILFFVLCILFLIYRYLEKKKDKKNIS